jgi:hypothetical protein
MDDNGKAYKSYYRTDSTFESEVPLHPLALRGGSYV